MADWLLDHDGDIYGDERDRLRWYEGIAIAASVQWIVVLATIAVLCWALPDEQLGPLLVVTGVFFATSLLGQIYASRKKAAMPSRWNRKRVVVTLLVGLPYLAIGLRLGYTDAITGSVRVGVLVGGLGGGLAGALFEVVNRQRKAALSLADHVDD
jgi:hypothetical protein